MITPLTNEQPNAFSLQCYDIRFVVFNSLCYADYIIVLKIRLSVCLQNEITSLTQSSLHALTLNLCMHLIYVILLVSSLMEFVLIHF